MNRALGITALAVVLALAPSCGGKEPSGPVAGNLSVRLTSPNSGLDSAIVLTITGPAVLTSATPGGGLRLFAQTLNDTTRFALVGLLTTGDTILTIGVPDVGRAAQYVATIQGVARPNYQLRALPGGYALAIVR